MPEEGERRRERGRVHDCHLQALKLKGECIWHHQKKNEDDLSSLCKALCGRKGGGKEKRGRL